MPKCVPSRCQAVLAAALPLFVLVLWACDTVTGAAILGCLCSLVTILSTTVFAGPTPQILFRGTVRYRADSDGDSAYTKALETGSRPVDAEQWLWDRREVPVWDMRVQGFDRCSVPTARPPGIGQATVHLLHDSCLETAVRQLDLAEYLMFGCDRHHLEQAHDSQQRSLCTLVKSLVIDHAARIWPGRDPSGIKLTDSSMFCATRSETVPPMHNVRTPGAHAGEVHLDIDVRKLGLVHSNHVNVWVPLNDFTQHPLCFLAKQDGRSRYSSPADSEGNYTQFTYGKDDLWVGAFPCVGEFYVWSPLLIPHAAVEVTGVGESDRLSVEFRFERID